MDSFDITQFFTKSEYVQESPARTPQSLDNNNKVEVSNHINKPTNATDGVDNIQNLKLQSDAVRKNNMTLASDVTHLHHQLKARDAEILALQSLLNQKNEAITNANILMAAQLKKSNTKINELEDKIDDSAITMKYLKNCILKFMTTTDKSEKKILFPVISTILVLSEEEMEQLGELI